MKKTRKWPVRRVVHLGIGLAHLFGREHSLEVARHLQGGGYLLNKGAVQQYSVLNTDSSKPQSRSQPSGANWHV